MNILLNKYGRFVSSLFVGKGKETRFKILEALFKEKMTRGELTNALFEKEFNRSPSYREKQEYGSNIFKRTKELLKYGFIEIKMYKKIKGNNIPVLGLTNKGFLTVALLSLETRNNLWKFLEAYKDEIKKGTTLVLFEEARKQGVKSKMLNKLLIGLEIEPFKRLVMSGEVNFDTISNEKLSILIDEIILTNFSRIMENMIEQIKKGKAPKLPNYLKSLSDKERRILFNIFQSPRFKERRKEEIEHLEKFYEQKLHYLRSFKSGLVEGNSKRLSEAINKTHKN